MTKSRNINAPKRTWSDDELALLRANYASVRTADLAATLGINLVLVYRRASLLGLRKSAEFAASDKSGRLFKGGKLGQLTQFSPGQRPWNTGTHYVAGGRSAETQFKPGRKPEESRNYLPIGTLRISKDGYLERKVTDDQSLMPARRWQFVHRIVWEAANGPIAPGHMVVFRPGQFTNRVELLTADRLACISRAENALRNSLWRTDPEIMRLFQLKGAIKRQVNRIKESQNVQPSH
jgi:hypothetical protein